MDHSCKAFLAGSVNNQMIYSGYVTMINYPPVQEGIYLPVTPDGRSRLNSSQKPIVSSKTKIGPP
ncbi:MAG: hypothetical protein JWR05_619 [Mucilaginibacter sp.]|nr:hypothetical protein [Mucilaginibacter sp.]